MTTRGTADIARALRRKGFRVDHTHHNYYELVIAGQAQRVRTFLSHGIDEYGDDLLAKVARELHLNKRELLDLIDCRLSGAQFVELLRQRGVLP